MGRIGALRGIGAKLNEDQVADFEAEHEPWLRDMAEPELSIIHRLDAHLLRAGLGTTR